MDAASNPRAEIGLDDQKPFRLGGATIDPVSREARFDGGKEQLQPQNLKVLIVLAGRRGKVVTRDEIVDLCWDGRVVGDDVINRAISTLRHVAERVGGFSIQTVPRVGYRLIVKERRRRVAWFLVPVLVLSVALIGFWLMRSPQPVTPTRPKVAVIGFASLNSGTEPKDFARSVDAAVSEALVTVGAEVVGTTADGTGMTPDLARRRGVTFLIAGTVRSDRQTIRVTAEVQDASTGTSLAIKDLAVPLAESASVPDRVAASVADLINSWSWFLRHERNRDRIAALVGIQTAWESDDVRAYHLSRELAEKTPGSGIAQFAFAFTTVFALYRLPRTERPEALAAARAAAQRAAILLPSDGDAYAVSCMLQPPGAWVLTAECDERYRHALALDREAYFLPRIYADEATETGRYNLAEVVSQRAMAVAPLDVSRMALRLSILFALSDVAKAHFDLPTSERQIARYAPPGTNGYVDWVRYQSMLWAGQMNRAEAMLNDPRTGPNLESDPRGPAHLIFKALESRRPADIQAARAACEPPPPSWLPPEPAFGTCLAGFQALNDLDDAFRLAFQAYPDVTCCSAAGAERTLLAGGGPQYPRDYLLGPAAAKMRADSRYIEIVRRAGLLAYWKKGNPPDFCEFEKTPVCRQLN